MSILERYHLWGEMINSFFSFNTYLTEKSLFQIYRPIFIQCLICSTKRRLQNYEKISKNSTYEIWKEGPIGVILMFADRKTDTTTLMVAFLNHLRKSLSKSLKKLMVLLTPRGQHWASVRTSSRSCSVVWQNVLSWQNIFSAGVTHTDHLWFALLSILCNK
jgi:hypothetical protein